MAHRPHPRGTTRNPADGPWTTCDRCGFVNSMNRMQFQYDFYGGTVPQNSGYLVCPRCLDDLAYQFKLLVLPPDPKPIMNTRPENYTLDESSLLGTEDGDTITTEDGEPITTAIPSPSQAAYASKLVSTFLAPGGSVAVAYLDLFDGDPTSGGASVLEAITGSATRTNIAASLTTVNGVARNPDYIAISEASESQTNISYVGIYDAASGGTLTMSGPVSASPTIALGNPVQFNPLGLTINLN